MATGRWVRSASCGALVVWLLAGCSGPQAQTPKPAVVPVAKAAEITDIRVFGTGESVRLTVTTSEKVAYSLVRQSRPSRLKLELAGVTAAGKEEVIPVNRGAVTTVKPSSSGANASIEIFLSAEATYEVMAQGTSVVVEVSPKPTAAPAATTPESLETAKPAVVAPVPAPAPVPVPAPPVVPSPVVITVATEEPVPEPAEPAKPAELAAAPLAAVPAGPRVLLAIDVKKQANGLVVALQGNGPLTYEHFLVEGRSLVVDIADASNKVWPMKRKVDDAYVTQIRIGEHKQPKKATRVVFDLKKLGKYSVEGSGDRIIVAFGAPELSATGAAAGVRRGGVTALNTVGEVAATTHDAATRLDIKTAVKADFAVIDSGDPTKVIIEIASATIAEKDSKTHDLSSQDGEVEKVSAFPYTKGDAKFVRIVAQLRRPAPFRTTAEDGRLLVDFEKPRVSVAARSLPAQASASEQTPVAEPAAVPPPAPTPAPAQAPASAPEAAPAAASSAPAAASSPSSTFTGRRLSLDFKDADVNDILRLISEVSGLNFVAGPEVKGTVSIKLSDVPWDQALDIILKTNMPQLAQIRESDNIMRITTADKILDEEQRRRRVEEDKKKTVDAQQALEPLITKSYAISYAKAKDIAEVVQKSFSSDRGKGLIQADERTNILIIQDLAAKVAEIDQVIQSLDTPTPAVLVEARIVEVSSDYNKDLGVQWGMSGIMDAAHGNATGANFPNSVNLFGTQGGNNLVNLPAGGQEGGTPGIGFSFGHIANTISLDLRLSAMETMGQSKTLSNPKILVVQNQKAVINVGQQLPIPKTDASGNRTVEWKDVGILLEVKPQVTNDKRVFMEIKIERSSPDTPVQTTEGAMYSLKTSRADTKVLIADGETTVIGGMFFQSEGNLQSGVPWFSKVPFFGWLFKNKNNKLGKSEMMIFLTPRLVVM